MFPIRFILVLLPVVSVLGQQPSVHVRLGTVGGQTQFHVGQPIPVALDFETNDRQSLLVNMDVRLRQLKPHGPDVFSAAPQDGVIDPLSHLSWTIDSSMPGMGLPSANLDLLHPVHVERDLNEFIVFRKPGHYVIHVVSTRVAGQTLQSNDMALDILPRDEAWTRQESEAAKAVLEAGKPSKEPERIFYEDKENAQIDAVRRLRYLDTEAATDYLASIFGRGRRTDSEVEFALYSSSYPEIAAKRLEQQIGEPDLTITQSYMVVLFIEKARALSNQNGHPLSSMEQKALYESLYKEAFEGAARKSPQAKADTYYLLLEIGSMRGSPEVRQKLIEVLPFASDYVLNTLFTVYWDSIKGAGLALVPVLKQIAVRPPDPRGFPVAENALRRIRELDPAAANEVAAK